MSSLPFPVSTPSNNSHSPHSHSHFHSHSRSISSFIGNRSKLLTQRARTTNLAVLLLSILTLVSLYYNLVHSIVPISTRIQQQRAAPVVPSSLLSTLPPPHSSLTHLVMVRTRFPAQTLFSFTIEEDLTCPPFSLSRT